MAKKCSERKETFYFHCHCYIWVVRLWERAMVFKCYFRDFFTLDKIEG